VRPLALARRASHVVTVPARLTPDQRQERKAKRARIARERRAYLKLAREDAKQAVKRAGIIANARPGSPFLPTPEDRARVETMAAMGIPHDQIALLVIHPGSAAPINTKTLLEHFRRELMDGVTKVNSKVAQSLYEQATGTNGAVRSTAAAIFWLRSRAGWKETQHVELDVKSGVLVAPANISPEAWVKAALAANAVKSEPGKKASAFVHVGTNERRSTTQ